MAVFFTCIILIGSGLTLFALMLILFEKRRLHDYRNDLKEKKEDLIKVIEDAEELISEMNRFSDYAVTQIEEKNDILLKSIAQADSKLELLDSYNVKIASLDSSPVYDETAVLQILEEEKSENDGPMVSPRKGKVLTFDLKRREIIKLARSGLDSTEIARLLNCGKGEIELIARIGR